MSATFYDGPQLTGEAISANVFCIIDASATPDTVIMADNGTTAPRAFVSTVALSSGQPLAGMQDGGEVLLKCANGQNPAANVKLTATANGEATAAQAADYVYAITEQPASGSAGYVIARLVTTPVVLA